MTPAQIEAQLRAEFPFFTVHLAKPGFSGDVLISPQEFPEQYEARLAEMVAAEVERQQTTADADAEATRREQIKTLYAALKAGTATSRQVQTVVAWLLRQQIRELLP